MTRKLLSWALCVILLFGITGCFGKRNQNGADAEEVVPLNVYMVAPEMTGAQSYIFTPYSMGDYTALLSAYGEEGYRYKNILENFEKDYPAELNITYFRFTDELDAQLDKDLNAGTLPDVVIEDSLSEVDAYRWFEADLFLDLMPYVEKDGLYTSGEYYNEVLRAGIYKEQQLIMPLSFNMNTIMTSEESLSRHIVNLDDNNLSELLAQFTDVAEKMRIEGENQEVLAQNCSRMTDFTIVILLSAAGEEYIDYETKTVNLNQKWFETMAVFYKSFFQTVATSCITQNFLNVGLTRRWEVQQC